MKKNQVQENLERLKRKAESEKLIKAVHECLPILNKRFEYEPKWIVNEDISLTHIKDEVSSDSMKIPDFSTQLHPAFCSFLEDKGSRIKLSKFFLDVDSELKSPPVDKVELIALSRFLETENLRIKEGVTFPKREIGRAHV